MMMIQLGFGCFERFQRVYSRLLIWIFNLHSFMDQMAQLGITYDNMQTRYSHITDY